MGFEYSCFISYRRGQGELMRTFTEEIKKALDSYIEPYLEEKSFIDDRSMQGGDFLDKRLAYALCKSVCMILIFVPKYFSAKHPYCTREFLAMENLEKRRFQMAGIPPSQQARSFIIPIVYRDPDNILSEVEKKGRRIYYDFSKYSTVEPNVSNNAKYVGFIDEIAGRIYELHQEFSQYDNQHNCDDFILPSETDALTWLEEIRKAPGAISSKQSFPVRQEGR